MLKMTLEEAMAMLAEVQTERNGLQAKLADANNDMEEMGEVLGDFVTHAQNLEAILETTKKANPTIDLSELEAEITELSTMAGDGSDEEETPVDPSPAGASAPAPTDATPPVTGSSASANSVPLTPAPASEPAAV